MRACLFSGGKDSTLALHKAHGMGIDVELLITMLSENKNSYMFHYPNSRFTELQAKALGKRHVFYSTKGEKEKELADLRKVLEENNVKTLVTGATYSKYQADRINSMAIELEIEHIAPLWHIDPFEELEELARSYEAIITAVSAEGLDETFLGKRIDKDIIKRLETLNRKHGINMLFEGGEAESFVLDAPLFSKKIHVVKASRSWDGITGIYAIEEARLEDK